LITWKWLIFLGHPVQGGPTKSGYPVLFLG